MSDAADAPKTMFVRIPLVFRKTPEFPGRRAEINPRTGQVVNSMSGGTPASGTIRQGEPFKEVPAEVAQQLGEMGFYAGYPISASNPPRFEVVSTREEADRLDAIAAERMDEWGRVAGETSRATGWER